MPVTIINASPYGNKNSNTKMIVDAFSQAVAKAGSVVENYSLSDRKQWKSALKAASENNHIVFAMPVYVGIVPSIFKEFAEELDRVLPGDVRKSIEISYILQSAFPESAQRKCAEKFLESVTESLKCAFSGILSHSVFFGLIEKGRFDNLSEAYSYFGKKYVENKFNFFFSEAEEFNGPEQLTEKQARKFVRGFNFMCRLTAEEKGCTKDLCDNPFEKK